MIPIRTSQNYHILCSHKDGPRTIRTVMTWITEEDEKEIDNLKDGVLIIERGNKTFKIINKEIHCYGFVDFNSKEDLDIIDKFKFLDYLSHVGVKIPSNYNYDLHSCESPIKRMLWTETWSPSELAKLSHGILNKPERIILFTQSLK